MRLFTIFAIAFVLVCLFLDTDEPIVVFNCGVVTGIGLGFIAGAVISKKGTL